MKFGIEKSIRNGEHFVALLLVELTLYVTPCAMEMPKLLAALLHDAELQEQSHQNREISSENTVDPIPPHTDERFPIIETDKIKADSDAIGILQMGTGHHPSLRDNFNDSDNNNDDDIDNDNDNDHHFTTPRRCSIEITNKIVGNCQPVSPIGNACVSGDYVDLFSLECM